MHEEWKPGTVYFVNINAIGTKTYREQQCWQMDRFIARMQADSNKSHEGKPEDMFTFAVVSPEEYRENRAPRRR